MKKYLLDNNYININDEIEVIVNKVRKLGTDQMSTDLLIPKEK